MRLEEIMSLRSNYLMYFMRKECWLSSESFCSLRLLMVASEAWC
jgi:hypothetical protein